MALTADEKQYLKSVESGKTPEQLKVLLSQYRRNKTTPTPAQATPTTQPQQPVNENLSKLQQDPTGLNSLLVPKTKKQEIRSTATEDLVGDAGKALWGLGEGAVNLGAGAIGAVAGAVSNPIQTTYNVGSGLAKAGQAIAEGASNTWNNPGKTLVDIGGGAVTGMADAVGNVSKFAGDTAGTVLDVASDLAPDITGIKAKQAELRRRVNNGDVLTPEEVQFMNSRIGDVARVAGYIPKAVADTVKKGTTEFLKEETAKDGVEFNPESGWAKFGEFVPKTALQALITKKLGGTSKVPISKSMIQNTKEGYNLGSRIFAVEKPAGKIKSFVRSALNTISENAPELAKFTKNSVINTGIYNSVNTGEVNPATLLYGLVADKALSLGSRFIKGGATNKYFEDVRPTQIDTAVKTGAKSLAEYEKAAEYGLKAGWSGRNSEKLSGNLGGFYKSANEQANEVAESTLKKLNLNENTPLAPKKGLLNEYDKLVKEYEISTVANEEKQHFQKLYDNLKQDLDTSDAIVGFSKLTDLSKKSSLTAKQIKQLEEAKQLIKDKFKLKVVGQNSIPSLLKEAEKLKSFSWKDLKTMKELNNTKLFSGKTGATPDITSVLQAQSADIENSFINRFGKKTFGPTWTAKNQTAYYAKLLQDAAEQRTTAAKVNGLMTKKTKGWFTDKPKEKLVSPRVTRGTSAAVSQISLANKLLSGPARMVAKGIGSWLSGAGKEKKK